MTKLPTEDVNNLPRGERRRRALALYSARMKQLGISLPDKLNNRLDSLGREILDPNPLTVPAFLEPLGQRIERLTRLGQARIDALYDFEEDPDGDDSDTDFGDHLDGVQPITPYEAFGGDFDAVVKRARVAPTRKPKVSSATTLPGEASEGSTKPAEASPEQPKAAS